MANPLQQVSPPSGLHPHHGPPGPHPQMNGHMPMQAHPKITPQHMAQLNEAVWLQIGGCSVNDRRKQERGSNVPGRKFDRTDG